MFRLTMTNTPHNKGALRWKKALCWLLLAICSGPGVSMAQEAMQETVVEITEEDAPPWQWLVKPRNQVSRNVTALGRNLDSWLAGEGIGEQQNETYLRIRFNQELSSYDGYHSRVKVGGSLDLPGVSQRWKLIFESDTDELKSLEDSVLGHENSGGSTGGFNYRQYDGEFWQLSHTVGLRARVPTDPFYRFKAKFDHQLGNNWTLGYRQKIWHYKSQGWGYDSDFSFAREIAIDKVLVISSEVKYQQNHQETEFSQSIALHHSPAELNTLSYELGILGSSKPNVSIDDYFVGVQYRRALQDDWLFVELLPQILVSREENWHPEPRFLMNLEMLFFNF